MQAQVSQTLEKITAAERYGLRPDYIIMSDTDVQEVDDAADRAGFHKHSDGIIIIDNMQVGGFPQLDHGVILLGKQILHEKGIYISRGINRLAQLLRKAIAGGDVPDYIIVNDKEFQELWEEGDHFYVDEVNAVRYQGFRVFTWSQQPEDTVDLGKFIQP